MFTSKVAARSLGLRGPQVLRVSQASRSYAAPVAQDSKPPVALFGVDGTYASALYTAAIKSSSLEPTAKSLESLQKSFKTDAKLATVLATPTLNDADKKSIVNELLKSASIDGSKDSTMKGFLNTLAENNRLSVLEGVCDKFGELMSAHRGEVELKVTSAAPLDNSVLKKLEQAVGKSRFVGQGKKLKMVSKVQPDIRGGIIVEVGDRTIDLSVASKLSRMNKMLRDSL